VANKKKRRRKRKSAAQRTEAQKQREEALRRNREQRRAEQEAEQRRKKWTRRLRRAALPVAGGVAVMTLALLLFGGNPELPDVVRVPEAETMVLVGDQAAEYDTPTPTSGPYVGGEPVCGVFDEQLPLPEAVAALRVGAVVLWHRPDVDPAPLRAIAEEEGELIVVSPNPDIEDAVVATAWNRRKDYDEASDDEIAKFVSTYQGRGEESGECAVADAAP
jgi:hypothetical protein